MATGNNMPLSRFSILNLARARSGPTAVRQLADWGANVIMVEMPPEIDGGDPFGFDRHGCDFQNLRRNCRSMTLNLKSEEGKEIFFKLTETADVVVENWRPDVKYRLGIDYESLRKVNPRIVYASISGFGQDGPYRSRPGLDQVAQGLGGIMSVNGKPESGPVRVGIPIADLTAGHLLAQGILIALLEREASGEGQWVYTSLLEAQIAMMDFQAARWLMRGEVPKQLGNGHPIAAAVGLFATADGELNIQASGDQLFKRLCETLGAPEMVDDPDYVDRHKRLENRDMLDGKIAELTGKFTSAELVEKLNEAGVPCGPVYTVDQVFADPQVKHLAMEPTVEHAKLGTYKVVGQPLHMSRTPQHMRNATPELGEHTEAVLAEIGYDGDAVAGLRQRNVI